MTSKPNYPEAVERVDSEGLRALLEKATKRPWKLGRQSHESPHMTEIDGDHWFAMAAAVTNFDGADPKRKLAMDAEGAANAALIVAAVNALPDILNAKEAAEGEVERLKPVPSAHEHMMSAVYRSSGPPTAEDYAEAIEDLQNARTALIEGDSMGCRVCEDSGHGANMCHHNPLLLARKWAAASRFWQCWHCGYTATNDAEGREHFGDHDGEPPSCIKAELIARAETAEAKLSTLEGVLRDVVDPLGQLKRLADERGTRLSGEAYSIANSLSYVQSIARQALSNLPKSGGVLEVAAADDDRGADFATADAEVARIMAMSDEEIMAEPGAAERAAEVGIVIARAIALHDIRAVRDKLQAVYGDQNEAPGFRNFTGSLADRLTDALAALDAAQPSQQAASAAATNKTAPAADNNRGAE